MIGLEDVAAARKVTLRWRGVFPIMPPFWCFPGSSSARRSIEWPDRSACRGGRRHMKRNGNLKAWLIVTLAGIMILPGVCAALPQAQSTQQPPAPKYPPQEYRDFQAARAETNAQQKLKLL